MDASELLSVGIEAYRIVTLEDTADMVFKEVMNNL